MRAALWLLALFAVAVVSNLSLILPGIGSTAGAPALLAVACAGLFGVPAKLPNDVDTALTFALLISAGDAAEFSRCQTVSPTALRRSRCE